MYAEWMAHLCGLCLTLRDLHGQSARLVTNYDGLLRAPGTGQSGSGHRAVGQTGGYVVPGR